MGQRRLAAVARNGAPRLRRRSRSELARRLVDAVTREGLREYYDPYTGRGMGATDFSWSALVLELADPDPLAGCSHLPEAAGAGH